MVSALGIDLTSRRVGRTLPVGAALLCGLLSQSALAGEAIAADDSVTQEPSHDRLPGRGFSFAAFGSYGAGTSLLPSGEDQGDEDGAADTSNVVGSGVGLRARYATQLGLSFGARFGHHFGEADRSTGLTSGLAEVGWVAPLGPLVLEPFLGAGVTGITGTSELCDVRTGQCSRSTSTRYATTVGAGLSLTYAFDEHYFAGVTGEAQAFVAPVVLGIGSVTVGARF